MGRLQKKVVQLQERVRRLEGGYDCDSELSECSDCAKGKGAKGKASPFPKGELQKGKHGKAGRGFAPGPLVYHPASAKGWPCFDPLWNDPWQLRKGKGPPLGKGLEGKGPEELWRYDPSEDPWLPADRPFD